MSYLRSTSGVVGRPELSGLAIPIVICKALLTGHDRYTDVVRHLLLKIMVPIRRRTYESSDNGQVAMSKLDWKVEKVKRLTFFLLNNSTVDTAKPWVGRIEKETKEFRITQTAPYLSPQSLIEGNFFLLFLTGRIKEEGTKSKIELEFRLGWSAFLGFAFFYSIAVLGIISQIIEKSWEGILASLAWILVFPTAGTLLLIFQLNRTENKLMDIFDV